MDLSLHIKDSESKYRDLLEKYFIGVFGETNLSSHDLDHHRRVWSYSKELLGLYDFIIPEEYDDYFVDKLLIASYLHDSGMSQDPGVRHGIHSRIFCERFLVKNSLEPAEFTDLLDTVTNHDRKEYQKKQESSALFVYLSVADDLDALGFTGIYRYIEIYLKRDIDLYDLGRLVISNVKERFDNFLYHFGKFPVLVEKHRSRFQTVMDFFETYNKELENYDFGNETPAGNCGVADIIGCSVNRNMPLEGLYELFKSFLNDQAVSRFYKGLKRELTASGKSIGS